MQCACRRPFWLKVEREGVAKRELSLAAVWSYNTVIKWFKIDDAV